MSPTSMREMVKRAYPSKRWAEQVDKMSDGQLFAILARLKRQGKI